MIEILVPTYGRPEAFSDMVNSALDLAKRPDLVKQQEMARIRAAMEEVQ